MQFSSRDGGEFLCDCDTGAFLQFRRRSRDIAEAELSFVIVYVFRRLELKIYFLREEKWKPSSLSDGTGQ